MNWCRAQCIEMVRTKGKGYIPDMIEAIKALDEQHPVFVSVSDLPCITAEIIQSIVESYAQSGKDACSTWIPVQVVESLRCSITYEEQICGIRACPTGINILRGSLIDQPQEEHRLLLYEPGLALNVNTRDDLAIAEKFLKHKSGVKSPGS